METKVFLKKPEKVLFLSDGSPQLLRMNNIDRIKWTECPGEGEIWKGKVNPGGQEEVLRSQLREIYV